MAKFDVISRPEACGTWNVARLTALIMRGRDQDSQRGLIYHPLPHQIAYPDLILCEMKHRRPAVPQVELRHETEMFGLDALGVCHCVEL
jgi:hypothetical protein